jgi:hypothetical protein
MKTVVCVWMAAATAVLSGCAEQAPEREAVAVEVHASLGLAVRNYDDGTFDAVELETGRIRFRIAYAPGRETGFGAYPAAPLPCPTQVSTNERLVVVTTTTIIVIDARTGRRLAERPRRARPFAVCPVVAPDGSIVEVWPAYHGSGFLVKRDTSSKIVYQLPIPDIGPIVDALAIDPATGNVLAVSDTHTMSVTATGQIAWILENPRPLSEGAGAGH